MNTSIYVCYHKKCDMLPDPVFKYIYCGAAVNGEENHMPGTLRDDAGDNISQLNPYFCECTALYWIWKNDKNSDYIGLMHYRRHLNFNDIKLKINKYGYKEFGCIDENYIKNNCLTKENIEKTISKYDITLPARYDCRSNNYKNTLELYKKSEHHHIDDYYILKDIINKKYNFLEKYQREQENDSLAYYTNIFIMKRIDFENYCKILFDILFEIYGKIDYYNYNIPESRAIGYLSERILDIYARYLINNLKFNVKGLQRTFVNNYYTVCDLKNYGQIPVVIACDNNFIKYASCFMISLMEHSSPQRQYALYILSRGISSENKKNIYSISSSHSNWTVNFIDCSHIFQNFKLKVRDHFTGETYFRFAIPEIFRNFDKIIYLDADTIVKKDIAQLYAVDLGDKSVAGVQDYMFDGMCAANVLTSRKTGSMKAADYAREYLDVEISDYIQCGVLIFNLEKIRKEQLDKKLFEHLDKHYWFVDQDIINIVFKGDKHYLDIRWNVANGNDDLESFYSNLPLRLHNKYFEARKDPFIIHYAGETKPWLKPTVSFANEFWKYARKSPFYEEILLDMYRKNISKKDLRKLFKDKIFPQNTLRHKVAKKIYGTIIGLFPPRLNILRGYSQ